MIGSISMICAVATASKYDGSWNSNCYSQSAQGQTQYGLDKMQIDDKTMAVDSAIYSDATCASKAIATIHSGGDLAVNSDSSAPAGTDDADLTLNSLTLAFHNTEYVSYMNSEQFCGYSNWAIDQAQDVLGKNCGGQAMPTNGSVSYDIIGLGTDGKLHMGLLTDTLTGVSVETRPTQLDNSITYSKAGLLIPAIR
jgi:hypothetical protein